MRLRHHCRAAMSTQRLAAHTLDNTLNLVYCIAFVCFCVCLWACYHDNSKLRVSILAKLGL